MPLLTHDLYNLIFNLFCLLIFWQLNRLNPSPRFQAFVYYGSSISLVYLLNILAGISFFSLYHFLHRLCIQASLFFLVQIIIIHFERDKKYRKVLFRMNGVVLIVNIILISLKDVFYVEALTMNPIYFLNAIFALAVLFRASYIKANNILFSLILLAITTALIMLSIPFTDFLEYSYFLMFLLSLMILSLFISLRSETLQLRLDKVSRTADTQDTVLKFISHDLRAPLVSINAFNSEIRSEDEEKKFTELTDKISSNVNTINDLIDKFVNMAKIQSNPLSLEWIELELFIRTVIYSNNQLFENIDYDLNYELGDIQLSADKFYFSRVIKNLLENAIKYRSRERKLKIKISLNTAANCNNEFCEFRFSDNGIGIEREHFDKLFDPHYRVLEDVGIDGLGYGLTIVKYTVDKHSWEVSIESEKDKGTTFIIRIPVEYIR